MLCGSHLGDQYTEFRLTDTKPNDIIVLMIPDFDLNGNLPPGLHAADWAAFVERFGYTAERRRLIEGLQAAAVLLFAAGCAVIYVDGSFVTAKLSPQDFDAVWETDGVNLQALKSAEPVFFQFESKRATQKAKFGGEFFPSGIQAGPSGKTFLEFFQIDREGNPKGLVRLNLKDMMR